MTLTKITREKFAALSNCIRILTADSVELAGSGHPGMPLGMADVMTILAFEFLKFNPNNPKWFGRDRVILSAGHGSMLLYSFYYLAGFKSFDLEDLKNYRQLNSKTPGHPEYGFYEAIETSTGPLGQGFANSVGMAIAAKKYEDELPSLEPFKIYCILGDGCLMEGISYEAASIAGHLKLNNLIVIFDNNNISIDGRTSLTVSEDHKGKFKAFGFKVLEADGHNFDEIREVFTEAQQSSQPVFISFKTTIGKGAFKKVDSEKSHGSPLGELEITHLKRLANFEDKPFEIPSELLNYWRRAWSSNKENYDNWCLSYERLSHPQKQFLDPDKLIDIESINKLALTRAPEPTRVSSGQVLENLMLNCKKVVCGSADLSLSNNMKNSNCNYIEAGNFSGNYIFYGVREHAMAAIMNGLALSGFLPIGGTFFVFSDYMKPAIRLAALMKQQVIYIMTHDSIGVGGDGPTHQPVEQLAALRALPNALILRPMDQVETHECWQLALMNKTGPSFLILTRQNVPPIRRDKKQDDNLCAKGAYIAQGDFKNSDLLIFASGSEVYIATQVASILRNKINICIISTPSFELFFDQTEKYISELIDNVKIKVAIEAGSSFGWHKIIGHRGIFYGVERFGASAPAEHIFESLGLTPELIASNLIQRLNL